MGGFEVLDELSPCLIGRRAQKTGDRKLAFELQIRRAAHPRHARERRGGGAPSENGTA
jgi:hypothetical protein